MSALSRKRLGFTLVEVLVAIAITVGLSAVLLNITTGTLNVWHRAQDTFTTDTQVRLAMDQLQKDLDGALFRSDGATWLAVDCLATTAAMLSHGWRATGFIKPATELSMNLVPSTLADARFGIGGAWLRFITTNSETKNSGNPGGSLPVAVSYQIARRPISGAVALSNPAPVRYTLFRSAVANETTFAAGYNVTSSAYGSSSATAAAARSARSLTNPNIADALVSNVVDVGVWLYTWDGTGQLRRIFPTTSSSVVHRAADAANFPRVADVMIRVLSEEGARAIENIEMASSAVGRPVGVSDSEWWWSVVETHSRVYIRRFIISGSSW